MRGKSEPRAALVFAQAQLSRFVEELAEFVRLPSISAQPKHAEATRRTAAWLREELERIGLDRAQVVPTRGHPIVYGEWRRAGGRPTVLIYGHYDVQPPEPFEAWHSPPFAPEVRGDSLYGRGACDDKGQLFAHLKAIESLLRAEEGLPVNVKCLFEGEEEIGSTNLGSFLASHRTALAADVAVLSDMRILGPDRPAITYGLRGALSLEVEVKGPEHDLHSGNFGGAVHNPLEAICAIVSSLHDKFGRVAIPGFYDQVRHVDRAERAYMKEAGPDSAEILRDAGARAGWGEPGYSLYERVSIRPALTVNGIVGGYQGIGSKAVIPSRAAVKLNLRLVPDQDPKQVEHLIGEHIRRVTPSTVTVSVRASLWAKPALVSRRHPAVQAAASAYKKAFGTAPVFLRSGGTIPIVSMLSECLGLPVVLMGFALPDSNLHAPNERFHLPTFSRAIATSIHFLSDLERFVGAPRQRDSVISDDHRLSLSRGQR